MSAVRASFLGLGAVLAVLACASGSSPLTDYDAGADAAVDVAAGCSAGQKSCSGACVDTLTSAAQCGKCGGACGAGESCCTGSCSSDCGFTLASLSADQGFVGGGGWITLKGTGFATGLRAFVGDGRAPVRAIDATTALMLTPPGTGLQDVRVELGAKKARLPSAFQYVAYNGFSTTWQKVTMSSARGNGPAIAVMQDGRVLIAGGTSGSFPADALKTADIYDPQTNKVTQPASVMSTARFSSHALTLLDGRVLVIGACNGNGSGYCPVGDNTLADLFDPKTNTFSPTKTPLTGPRIGAVPTLLPDGRVLVTSGVPQIFDPATDSFTDLPASPTGEGVRLRDGRVFLGSQIFDPDDNTFSSVGGSFVHGYEHFFTLPDGRVLAVAGADGVSGNVVPHATIETFDPKGNIFSTQPYGLSLARLGTGAAQLRDATILVLGGITASYPQTAGCQTYIFEKTATVEVIDPTAGSVSAFTPLPEPNITLVAATLLDGSIVAGGGAQCGGAASLPYIYFLKALPRPT